MWIVKGLMDRGFRGHAAKKLRVLRVPQGAAAVCHGTAILCYAKLYDGEYLVRHKTVTGISNLEEDYADETLRAAALLPREKRLMPWRIEDELKVLGANYIHAGSWRGFAVRAGI